MTEKAQPIESEVLCKCCLVRMAQTKYIWDVDDGGWNRESIVIQCSCGYSYSAKGIYKKL